VQVRPSNPNELKSKHVINAKTNTPPGAYSMIKISGLTPLQVELCDHIWSLGTQEEVIEWLSGLPKSLRIEATMMMQMIIAEIIDNAEVEDLSVANAVINRIKQL
jgi:hypothetical protein